MLHHVGLEIEADQIERSVEFWRLLGFGRVDPPESLAGFTWLEREGTQIHLMPTESPRVPARGHTAVVTPDFEGTVARLREHGFEVKPRREHWGAPRPLRLLGLGGDHRELVTILAEHRVLCAHLVPQPGGSLPG